MDYISQSVDPLGFGDPNNAILSVTGQMVIGGVVMDGPVSDARDTVPADAALVSPLPAGASLPKADKPFPWWALVLIAGLIFAFSDNR